MWHYIENSPFYFGDERRPTKSSAEPVTYLDYGLFEGFSQKTWTSKKEKTWTSMFSNHVKPVRPYIPNYLKIRSENPANGHVSFQPRIQRVYLLS